MRVMTQELEEELSSKYANTYDNLVAEVYSREYAQGKGISLIATAYSRVSEAVYYSIYRYRQGDKLND